jgi:hypothetical protein
MDLPPLFQQLADEHVDVVLVGGLAAFALGVPYLTADVDLCFDPEPANVTRLVRALGPLHPRLRVEGLSDEEARALPFELDVRALRQAGILTLQTDVATLDIMTSVNGIGSYAEVRQAAIELEAFGFRLAVLDLPGLIAAKRAAGRPKDLLALPQIEAALRLREQRQRKDANQ